MGFREQAAEAHHLASKDRGENWNKMHWQTYAGQPPRHQIALIMPWDSYLDR